METRTDRLKKSVHRLIERRLNSIDNMPDNVIEEMTEKYEKHFRRITRFEQDEIEIVLAKKGLSERDYFKRIIQGIGAVSMSAFADEDEFGYDECAGLNSDETYAYSHLEIEKRLADEECEKSKAKSKAFLSEKLGAALGNPEFQTHPDVTEDDMASVLADLQTMFDEEAEEEDNKSFGDFDF